VTEIELFKLNCWSCSREIEISCTPPHRCTHCGADLDIQFRADDAETPDNTSARDSESAEQLVEQTQMQEADHGTR
jgi:hypothetical protein